MQSNAQNRRGSVIEHPSSSRKHQIKNRFYALQGIVHRYAPERQLLTRMHKGVKKCQTESTPTPLASFGKRKVQVHEELAMPERTSRSSTILTVAMIRRM